MPRTVQITVPKEQTDALIAQIQRCDGLISLRLQRDISLHPAGDVVLVDITNRSLPTLMRLLDTHDIGRAPHSSITTSEPTSIVSPSSNGAIVHDTSEATWEEMETIIGKESNMTASVLIIMGISGILATIGIATNALHLVIAAMVIAPGFEPITRIGLGAVGRSAGWRRGLSYMLQGYLALALGAAATTLVLRGLGKSPLGGEVSYLPAGVLVSYWTTITIPSLLVTAVASIAGALLIASNRSVLTAGVMIALALVPTAAITSMALATGNWGLSGQALLRWLIEVGFVMIFSVIVFGWKRARLHQRDTLL